MKFSIQSKFITKFVITFSTILAGADIAGSEFVYGISKNPEPEPSVKRLGKNSSKYCSLDIHLMIMLKEIYGQTLCPPNGPCHNFLYFPFAVGPQINDAAETHTHTTHPKNQ